MLYEFLKKNKNKILDMTENLTLELAGTRPTSVQLKQGLPLFFSQLIDELKRVQESNGNQNKKKIEKEMSYEGGKHGAELLRLGYTITHVVHAYGSMCQSITQLATSKDSNISNQEFHDLNRCLDTAIAGAVEEFQLQRNHYATNRDAEHLGFLAHELRNALTSIKISLEMIELGKVGFSGSTAEVLKRGIRRMDDLITRSLTEVRLKMDLEINVESFNLLQFIESIILSEELDANEKNQKFAVQVSPSFVVQADQQYFFSAVSNIIQNAIKYTRNGGLIQIRAHLDNKNICIEVEDECGGILVNDGKDIFNSFVQGDTGKRSLGLGLAVAMKAIKMNHGNIEAHNVEKKGCIFTITIPKSMEAIIPEMTQDIPRPNQTERSIPH